jgi:glycerate kinase
MPHRRIPSVIVVAPDRFSARLSAARVAAAIARGLGSVGWECDICPLGDDPAGGGWRAAMQAAHLDERLRAARAVVTGSRMLDRRTLVGSLTAEVATSARQSGVPCYAIVGRNELSRFEQRIVDLEVVLEAASPAALERAGAELGQLLLPHRISGRTPDAPPPAPVAAAP